MPPLWLSNEPFLASSLKQFNPKLTINLGLMIASSWLKNFVQISL